MFVYFYESFNCVLSYVSDMTWASECQYTAVAIQKHSPLVIYFDILASNTCVGVHIFTAREGPRQTCPEP